MLHTIEGLVGRFEEGKLSRRGLIQGLLAVAIAPAASAAAQAPQAPDSLVSAVSVGHVNILCTDHERSAEFYGGLLGAKIRDKGYDTQASLWTMTLPGATRERGIWLSMNQIKPDYRGNRYGLPGYGSSRVGTYDHVAFGVTPLDSQALVEKINKRWPFAQAVKTPLDPRWAGPSPETNNRDGVYCQDPDGLRIQLVPPSENGELQDNATPIPNTYLP